MAAGGFSPSASGIDPAWYPAPSTPSMVCNYDPNARSRWARSSAG